MPLPFILGVGAVVAGAAGVKSGIDGAVKMKEANNRAEYAQNRNRKNIRRMEEKNKETIKSMDNLGEFELKILEDFDKFSNLIEKIQNRPNFKKYNKNGVEIPEYNPSKLKDVSIGAGVLLGGLGGAAAGTAGGFAAAGATTAAVMALGTASTGTAIASLSGVAATNATLAALGGGALAAGGGGIALGTTVLSAATLGVGLLVGGMIFNATGNKLSSQADEAYDQMLSTEKKINKICNYYNELEFAANRYYSSLREVKYKYDEFYTKLNYTIYCLGKTDWYDFTQEEKNITEALVLVVGLLYNMCKVQLVLQTEDQNGLNEVNDIGITKSIYSSHKILNDIGYC